MASRACAFTGADSSPATTEAYTREYVRTSLATIPFRTCLWDPLEYSYPMLQLDNTKTCDLVNLSQDFLHSSWQSSWTESSQSKGKSYSTIQPTIPSKPWFFKIHFAKRVTTCLIRMRLGHVSTPAHLFKFKIVDSPACDCGAEVCDVNHIFFSCSLNDALLSI